MKPNFTNHQNIKTKLRQASAFIIVLLIANLFLVNNCLGQNSQIFNSNGTFTLPVGVTSITVEAWGGGAGGNANVYGGGGGGAYSKITITNPNSTYSVVIGQGGSAGSNGTNSTFGSVLTANGAIGANGGVASVGVGITSFKGGNGAGGTTNSGGGAGASAAGAGADGSGSTGGTGVSPGGSGGNGSNSSNGQPGSIYGGGGGSRGFSGGSGSGARGAVIVTWCPSITASATKNDVQCFNTSTGQIIINGSGGTAPYTFSINNGTSYQSSGTFNNLPVGTYQIRVKDANGCESKSVQ